MDRAVGVVPDFLDDSFDGAGCLLPDSTIRKENSLVEQTVQRSC